MNAENIAIDQIIVPDFVERPLAKIADDRDRRSIQQLGIQQPLVCIRDGERLLLAKGLRRLRIARSLGIQRVPVVAYDPPRGYDAEQYCREVRLVLDMHRQDLRPSQKCALVEELKRRFGMKNKEVAVYLGKDADSITNWLAVRQFIPPVVEALDTGAMTMDAARVFVGLTEEGQRTIFENFGDELRTKPSKELHQFLRKEFAPKRVPEFYRNPEIVQERLNRARQPRETPNRSELTANEKRRMSTHVQIEEQTLVEEQARLARMESEITAAIAPIAAILRDEHLTSMLDPETLEKFTAFAGVYID